MTGPFDTPDLPHAVALHRQGQGPDRMAYDLVVLTYDERILRRRRMLTVHDEGFFVDLPQTTGLDQGDRFELADGRLIEVMAAEEYLLEITGDLPRLSWHIGNRHTPCQFEPDRILIRQDHVLEAMLAQLGATVRRVSEPFAPEGGAYGHGRTMGHDHGLAHDHGHASAHHHDHPHPQDHDHGHDHDHSHDLPAKGPFDPSR
jgi:urease accessory protein